MLMIFFYVNKIEKKKKKQQKQKKKQQKKQYIREKQLYMFLNIVQLLYEQILYRKPQKQKTLTLICDVVFLFELIIMTKSIVHKPLSNS